MYIYVYIYEEKIENAPASQDSSKPTNHIHRLGKCVNYSHV
jgi:hypothetical protein